MRKKKKNPSLEELVPDENKRQEMLSRLYHGDPILGDGRVFTEMLQAFVNAALEEEKYYHLNESRGAGQYNRRNGHTEKVVRSQAGPMQVKTPRDRLGAHDPKLIKKWQDKVSKSINPSQRLISLFG